MYIDFLGRKLCVCFEFRTSTKVLHKTSLVIFSTSLFSKVTDHDWAFLQAQMFSNIEDIFLPVGNKTELKGPKKKNTDTNAPCKPDLDSTNLYSCLHTRVINTCMEQRCR